MISALDRHFGFSGGESLALLAVIAIFAWLALPSLPEAMTWTHHARDVFAHVCVALND